MVKIALVFFLILLPCWSVLAKQPAVSFSGIGILVIREDVSGNSPLTLYEYPGIKRIAEVNFLNIPRIFSSDAVSSGAGAIAVMGKRGDWLKISFDEAGRGGWVNKDRLWKYTPWSDFLKGRRAVLLAGLRKTCYLLRKEASDSSGPLETLAAGQDMEILDVDGDWAQVMVKGPETGWVRWRGGDGRLMISLGGGGL